ncbi:hypothetical protein [Actinoplanes teichomyceticus]|uniref:Putative membrane protein YkgB n=1 Tax=Actinoplanes teichomyceticus TaxID=1867 RepID=A0A561VLR4_ACTTI|nr:hypothetical protein [Actinoplanes teichomyceticus]TWG12547.1 putative membrane protein YkgB [Actinoplanes teichomyceticus]
MARYRLLERRAVGLCARHRMRLLRLSLGAVLFWFGVLKFVPGLSPADALAIRTIDALSFGLVTGGTGRLVLAVLETFIGVALLTGRLPRAALAALLAQMAGTLTPLVLFPAQMWQHALVPSLEGQYILKNMVLIAAALTLVGTLSPAPEPLPQPLAAPREPDGVDAHRPEMACSASG